MCHAKEVSMAHAQKHVGGTGTSRGMAASIQHELTRPLRQVGALVVATLLASGCENATDARPINGGEVVTFREHYNNAHLITVDGDLVLVDAGLEADAPGLDARLRERGVDPADLGAVILTHGHADHAGGARWFQEQYGTPIVVAAADLPILDTGTNGDLCPTDDDARAREADDEAETFTPFAPSATVGGNGESSTDLQAFAGIEGRIVAVPGHTDGSLVVIVGNAAFVGDLFRGDIFSAAARVHFYNCDLTDNHDDIRALLQNEAANVDEFFVGHFGPVSRAEVEKLIEHWPETLD